MGAVLVHEGQVVSRAGNEMEARGDPTSHAELLTLREGVHKLGRFKMAQCTLFVTLEPCPMCAGALLQTRVGRVVYGARNPLLGRSPTPPSFTSLHRNPIRVSYTESPTLLTCRDLPLRAYPSVSTNRPSPVAIALN